MALFLPQERVLPAFFRENPDDVFGSGGRGASLCLSCGVLQSSWPGVSIDEGAVDAALNREELSVVDAVFVFDAPLPRLTVLTFMPSKRLSSLCESAVPLALANLTPPSKDGPDL